MRRTSPGCRELLMRPQSLPPPLRDDVLAHVTTLARRTLSLDRPDSVTTASRPAGCSRDRRYCTGQATSADSACAACQPQCGSSRKARAKATENLFFITRSGARPSVVVPAPDQFVCKPSPMNTVRRRQLVGQQRACALNVEGKWPRVELAMRFRLEISEARR